MAVSFDLFYTAVSDVLPETESSVTILKTTKRLRSLKPTQLDMLATIFSACPDNQQLRQQKEWLRIDLKQLSTNLEIPLAQILKDSKKQESEDKSLKDAVRELVKSHEQAKEVSFDVLDTLSADQAIILNQIVTSIMSHKTFVDYQQLKAQKESLQPKALYEQVQELKEKKSSKDLEDKQSASSEESEKLRQQLKELEQKNVLLQSKLDAHALQGAAPPPPPPPPPLPGESFKTKKRPATFTPALEKKYIREMIQDCVQAASNQANNEKLKELLFPPLGKQPDHAGFTKRFKTMLTDWVKNKRPADVSEDNWHQKIFASFEKSEDSTLVAYDLPNMAKTLASAEDHLVKLLAGDKEKAKAALSQELAETLAKRKVKITHDAGKS